MSSQSQQDNLVCYTITAATASDVALSKVLGLSKSIFKSGDAEYESRPTNQLWKWKEEIAHQDSIVLYAATRDAPETPIGLLYVTPRTAPEIGQELQHIWIAGVDPAYRGFGVFPFLMKEALNHARDRGQTDITVCTYPAIFPKMYRILQQNAWQHVAWRENGEKVLMKLSI